MAEYIDRAKAIDEFEQCNARNPRWTPQRVKTLLLRIPTADVAPVMHGEWMRNCYDRPAFFVCNRCGTIWYDDTSYCPNCGAKMDGGGNGAAD